MRVNFFSTAAKFLKQDFNTSLSIGYLSLVVIGMIFEGCLYLCFHINIVQYSDISDFLLAPFRNPIILVFVAMSVSFIYLITLLDEWTEKKYPRVYKWMYCGMDIAKSQELFSSVKGGGLVLWLYICFTGTLYADIKEKTIKTTLVPKTELTFKDNKFEATDTLIYIGKTNGYIFLYNRTKKQTDVVPMGDVLKIEVRK
jgi:hypothetical protein